jgi:hypothetical protein
MSVDFNIVAALAVDLETTLFGHDLCAANHRIAGLVELGFKGAAGAAARLRERITKLRTVSNRISNFMIAK